MALSKQRNPRERIKQVEKSLGIKFKSARHVLGALMHTSLLNQTQAPDTPVFERLEFFGDSVLNVAICEKLLSEFPNVNEGTLSRLRSTLVSKKILNRIAKKLSIGKFVMIAPNDYHHANSKLLSDTLEALIGAIYFDRGFRQAREFVWKNWDTYFDQKKLAQLDPNPKSTLQEIAQKVFRVLPTYHTKPAKNGFSATVSIQKKFSGKGIGISKQEAEANAAESLLKKLRTKKIYSKFFNK